MEKFWGSLKTPETPLKTHINYSQQDYIKWIISSTMMIIVTAILFYDDLRMAVIMVPYIIVYVKEKKREKDEEDKRNLSKQFSDALTAVTFSLNVGHSVENAFREATKEMVNLYGKDSRIVKEFRSIVRKLNNNENIEEVLVTFANNCGVEDIYYFVEIFRYAKRTGGDLISIIKNTTVTIRQRNEVEQEIQTVISGKKMEQRVMSVMPFGMIAYIRLTSPDMMSSLYGNTVGAVIMSICLAIWLFSNYMAKRIVNIRM